MTTAEALARLTPEQRQRIADDVAAAPEFGPETLRKIASLLPPVLDQRLAEKAAPAKKPGAA